MDRGILKSQHAKCPFLQIQIINQWILIFLAPPQSNLAPLFCVRANGKRAYNPSKSRKRFKSKAVPSFLGDAGLIKVVLEFLFGYPKCHFLVPEYGHFWQKYPAQHPPKMMAQIVWYIHFCLWFGQVKQVNSKDGTQTSHHLYLVKYQYINCIPSPQWSHSEQQPLC